MAKTLSRIKTVEITYIEGGQEKTEKIQIVKAGLGKWKKLTDSIKNLFGLLPEVLKEKGIEDPEKYIEGMSPQDLLMLIPDLLEVAAEEFLKIISLGADLDQEYIEEKVGLDETVDIFEAIVEVNNLVKVAEKGKNLMGLWRTVNPQR